MKGLIAVDGGGTKTEFILTDINGNVLTRNVYAGTNLNSVSYEEAFLTLATGVKDIFKVAENNAIEVEGAFFGLAGGLNGNNQQLVYDYFKPRYFEGIAFSNHGDELNAINTGVKNAPDGIVVIAGTGSNVAIKKDGQILPNPQLSGWGYFFDNGGSGFDYGRDVILAAKAHNNGTGMPTIITSMLEEKLQKPVFDSLKEIYSGGASTIASFAPIAFNAYRNQDFVASKIIENQVNNVANLINNAHEKIGSETKAVVGLVGGIFAHEREILEPLISQQIDSNLTLTFPEESQIYGALVEAAKNANVETDELFLQNYNNTISKPLLQQDVTTAFNELQGQ